jgi:hypothetical protein
MFVFFCNMFRNLLVVSRLSMYAFVSFVTHVSLSRGNSANSMCYVMILKSISKKYIPLSNHNFDDVIMSRGN